MKKLGLIILVLGSVLLIQANSSKYTEDSKLSETLFSLGFTKPNHFINYSTEQVEQGKELVYEGRTIGPDGKQSRFISKYYNCLSCHNTVKEDPNPAVSDPEARLDYAIQNDIPFLQATTFRGIVSRESFYNGDYEKKYGDLVEPARNNLREAIQLCAVQCAQGRKLESWELEAILAYFWTIDYTLAELNLSDDELFQLNYASERGRERQAIDLLRTKYLKASPATFVSAPQNLKKGYEAKGSSSRGKEIFERSCLHCHEPDGVSSASFHTDFSFDFLERTFYKNKSISFYSLIRNGTYAMPGHRPYMPNYSKERLSDKQVEDLRAYNELKAQS